MNQNHIIVYPPRAPFSIAWETLPLVFPHPEKWINKISPTPTTVEFWQRLGYTVSRDDHTFSNGAHGGGLIHLNRDSKWWFPKLLLLSEATFEPAPGFGKGKYCPISILVPRITYEHKLKLIEMPKAPSPLFSVELVSDCPTELIVAIAGTSMSCPENGILAEQEELMFERQEAPSAAILHWFSRIESKKLNYRWYRVKSVKKEIRMVIAQLIYIGLDLNSSEATSVSRLHVFAPSGTGPEWDFSANRWQQKTRVHRLAIDW